MTDAAYVTWIDVLYGSAVLRPETAVRIPTIGAPEAAYTNPNSPSRKGLNRAFNPPPVSMREARLTFFKQGKAPASKRGRA